MLASLFSIFLGKKKLNLDEIRTESKHNNLWKVRLKIPGKSSYPKIRDLKKCNTVRWWTQDILLWYPNAGGTEWVMQGEMKELDKSLTLSTRNTPSLKTYMYINRSRFFWTGRDYFDLNVLLMNVWNIVQSVNTECIKYWLDSLEEKIASKCEYGRMREFKPESSIEYLMGGMWKRYLVRPFIFSEKEKDKWGGEGGIRQKKILQYP